MSKAKYSPKEFLKARRPEKFSDSVIDDVTELDRSLLEYHLETLTNRSQETEFERFGRSLAQLEVCPNLLPHTGPTGGGDSKVDSETFPVADSLAMAWYIGIGRESASERWAFAFSAKADWRGKLKSDVDKIKKTDRNYKKAFFVTNQFVRDKVRGELEDELSKQHGIDVRILDRTWILDAVFNHHREDIAVAELGVSSTIRRRTQKGPRDLERESELTQRETRINDSVASDVRTFTLVEDCIEAAIISRELERPIAETLGRFDRADMMARQFGTQHQQIKCAYDRAWTAYFWFEDIDHFPELYSVVESRAKDSENIYDIELLSNLWQLLYALAEEKTVVESQTQLLLARLRALAQQAERPSSSLQAQSLQLKVRLLIAIAAKTSITTILGEIHEVIHQSETLIGFPLESLVETLLAVGQFLPDVPAYDDLHESLAEIIARRKGEIAAANLFLQRGEQQLDAQRPNDAIRSFGKAFPRLAKNESRHRLCRALYFCACSYERTGLLWAARGSPLAATAISISDFWKYEKITPFQASCCRRLKWIELQLGRLPQLLAWHDVDSRFRAMLAGKGYDRSRLSAGDLEFDAALGLLLLRTDLWRLKNLVKAPDVLDAMGLHSASIALLHALGHETDFDAQVPNDDEWQDKQSLFVQWRDQPASDELPMGVDPCDESTHTLCSNVLGCEIEVEIANASPFVELAESLLAAIEATLATGIVRRIATREARLFVTVRRSDYAAEPFEYALSDEAGHPKLTISCPPFTVNSLTQDAQSRIQNRLASVIGAIVARITVADERQLEQLFGEDAALPRAIDFTSSMHTLGVIFGPERKIHTSQWIDNIAREYAINRDRAWDEESPRATPQKREIRADPNASSGDSERPLPDLERTKHSQIRMLSPIRDSLWNKAKWQGLGFIAVPDEPPILAIIFGKREPARQIFELWQHDMGARDNGELLRVSIVRHISKRHPHHYRVLIGANVERTEWPTDVAYFQVMQRIHTMEPTVSTNLDMFLERYQSHREYLLVPAVVVPGGSQPELIPKMGLMKNELFVREAWEIGLNDFDRMGILPNDDPIIPEGIADPPVNNVLKANRDHVAAAEPQREARASGQKERRKKRKDERQRSKKGRRRT